MEKGIKKFFGNKRFYKQALIVILPIIAQQLFLSIAGYVDSLMINAYGGAGVFDAYNGVSAANRLMFVFSFLFIGIASASSIFISQYYGAGNREKISESYNLAVIVAIIFGAVTMLLIELFGDAVVDLYIQSEEGRYYGYRYLDVMRWGMIVTAVNMVVSTSFRSVKQTILPMVAGIIGILINIIFNYLLIFGHYGFPELDASGAAIATVLSRCVELAILVVVAFTSKRSYFKDSLKHLKIDKGIVKAYFKKGTPLIANEVLWSLCMVVFVIFYTYKNDVWYNAYAYAQNISDLFFIFFAGLGNGTAILLGASLGADDFERAKRDSYRLKGLAIMMGVFMGALMVTTSPYIVMMFDPDPVTKKMVVDVLTITAIFVTLYAYNSTCFFILRAGGDSIRAFSLDQGATFLVSLPLTIILGINASNLGLTLPFLFLISHVADIIKFFLANNFVKKEKWLCNLTKKNVADEVPMD